MHNNHPLCFPCCCLTGLWFAGAYLYCSTHKVKAGNTPCTGCQSITRHTHQSLSRSHPGEIFEYPIDLNMQFFFLFFYFRKPDLNTRPSCWPWPTYIMLHMFANYILRNCNFMFTQCLYNMPTGLQHKIHSRHVFGDTHTDFHFFSILNENMAWSGHSLRDVKVLFFFFEITCHADVSTRCMWPDKAARLRVAATLDTH